jgi:uncharacterized protein YecE (DUF72 family)
MATSKRRAGRFRVGTSGYQYTHWRGIFYPEGLALREWLPFYAEHFDSVELNATFYRLPETRTFEAWRSAAPTGFGFAVKFSRYGSHLKHLKSPRQTIRAFLQRARRLRQHLGPILVQLPPHWRADPERLAGFLRVAKTTGMRWAFEFRDPTWLCEPVFELLRQHRAALCLHDMLDDHPRVLTTDWTYLRFHGPPGGDGYAHQALSAHARRIRSWLADGTDIYAYFNNDAEGHAVVDARALRRYVTGLGPRCE